MIANLQPEGFKPNLKRDNSLTPANLSLSHVFGFRTKFGPGDTTCSNTAKYVSGKVVFVSAGVGVVMDQKSRQQSFFLKHMEDVISVAVHPSGKVVATGQYSPVPNSRVDIYVWEAEEKSVRAWIDDFHLNGVCCLEFSPDGTLLLSVGLDKDNSLAIHDWSLSRLINTAKVDTARVNAVAWKSNTEFVTAGDKSVILWTIQG